MNFNHGFIVAVFGLYGVSHGHNRCHGSSFVPLIPILDFSPSVIGVSDHHAFSRPISCRLIGGNRVVCVNQVAISSSCLGSAKMAISHSHG